MKVSEFHKKTIHLLYTEWVELFTWMQKVRYLLKNVASLYLFINQATGYKNQAAVLN